MGHKVPRQRGEGRGELEEISQRTYMLICIAHGHKQPGGEGRGGWVEGAKWGQIEETCSSANNTKKTANLALTHQHSQADHSGEPLNVKHLTSPGFPTWRVTTFF